MSTSYAANGPGRIPRRQALKLAVGGLGAALIGTGGWVGDVIYRETLASEAAAKAGLKVADQLYYSLGISTFVSSATWLAERGIHELTALVNGKRIPYKPDSKVGAAPPGQVIAPAKPATPSTTPVHPASARTAPNRVFVMAADGTMIALLPRAAQALAAVVGRLRHGSPGNAPMTPTEAMEWILPVTSVKDVNGLDSSIEYSSRRANLVQLYHFVDTAGRSYERLVIADTNQAWTFQTQGNNLLSYKPV